MKFLTLFMIPEPPEMTLLDDNISTIAANIAGPSMLFIPHLIFNEK